MLTIILISSGFVQLIVSNGLVYRAVIDALPKKVMMH